MVIRLKHLDKLNSMRDNMRILKKSKELILECQAYSSSKRVDLEGTYNFVIDKGQGAYVWDIDGNRYIDYTSSTGAIILGYRYQEVDNAVIEQIKSYGSIFTTTLSRLQLELAKKILNLFKGYERVLFFRTGSCATTAAVRLARIYTGKKIVLTSGYHGWHDWHLSIFPRFNVESADYLDFAYNLNLLKFYHEKHKGKVACTIITPEPTFFPKEYFEELYQITKFYKSTLIFDEVMCGFRINYGGFYAQLSFIPDLLVIGKGLANGYALSAILGKKEIMVAREETHLVGTFHNEQTPMAAAIATLDVYMNRNVINKLEKIGNQLAQGLKDLFSESGIKACVEKYPALFHIIFDNEAIETAFHHLLQSNGILFHPFDPQMVNFSHSESDINYTLQKVREVLKILSKKFPEDFNLSDISLSQTSLDFRTLHEFGGLVNYKLPIEQIPINWVQNDR